ncbi:MAG: TolC family protein [Candidatus Marinimicrobia bacterium]|nr:TolC family protein [Candidatus Neomarinimicrobiota bacterium]
MRRVRFILFLIVLLTTSAFLSAQVIDLTLEKARELALVNNPQVKLAREAILKADARVIEARAGLLPTFSAFSSYQRAWEIPVMVMEIPPMPPFSPGGKQEIKLGLENTLLYGFQFSQPIFVGGAVRNGYQISQSARRMTKSQLQATRQAVLMEVTNAYNGVLFARSVMGVMQQSVAAAEKNLEQVRKFRATGKSSDFDVLRADVQLANYMPQLVSARNNAHLAVSNLLRLLGLSNNELVIISDELTYVPSEHSDQDFQELVHLALEARPEIAMLGEQHTIAQKQLSLARASLMPSLVLGTSYQYQGQSDDLDFTGDEFTKSFNSSLSLSVPIFSGLGNNARIQQAKIGLNETNYQKEALIQSIKLEVEGAYYTMKEAEQNVATQSKVIASAEEALRLVNLRYTEGASTQLEVMNVEVALNQARLNYQRTLFGYNTALTALKKALNQL